MPSNLVLFTSGGREYAAVSGIPEGASRFHVQDFKVGRKSLTPDLVYSHQGFIDIVPRRERIELPEGNWTIVGRLNELSPADQVKFTFYAFTCEQIHNDPIDDKALILLKQ